MLIHPLAGAHFKIERADERADELDRRLEKFLGGYPYELNVEGDQKTGYIGARPKVLRESPVVEWGGLIGEIIHPLRSSLDHLVWALTVDRSGPAPVPLTSEWRRVAFPVFPSEHTGDRSYAPVRKDGTPRLGGGAGQMLWGIDPAFKAVIKRLQPFSCGEQFSHLHPLTLLDELWNIDKHRRLTTCVAYFQAQDLTFESPYRFEVVQVRDAGPFEQETEEPLFQLQCLDGPPFPNNPKVKVNGNLRFDITFNEAPPIGQRSVGETLTGVRTFVVNVLDYFGPLLNPPGP